MHVEPFSLTELVLMQDADTGESILMECLVDLDDNFVCTEAHQKILGNS